VDYHFAYFLLDLCLLPIWFVLFVHRKDLRHKIMLLGLLIGIVAMITEFWYTQDYWHPLTLLKMPFSIEDFLFGFFIGGISSVFYEELFGKRFSNRHTRSHHWALLFIIFFGISELVLNLLFYYFRVNSIYSSFVAFAMFAFGVIYFRRDLITDAIISGLLCGLVLLGSYLVLLNVYPGLFIKMWYLNNLSGIFIGKIPIEEILWAFSWGMIAGPMYEFYAGLKFKKSGRY
jgi:hypothetical protein